MRRLDAPLRNGWTGDAVLARLGDLAAEETRRRRLMAIACATAIVLHALFALLVPRPRETSPPLPEILRRPLVLTPIPRFRPPEPAEVQPQPPSRRIPMPDPTPDELEPIVAASLPAPVIDVPIDPGLDAIPAPPPEPTLYEVGNDVSAPVKIHAPDPIYPRVALLARRGGAVVVEATIDRRGRVTAARALTHRGFGLEEAALAAIEEWRFEPALRHGEPVPVLYRLTVHFSTVH